MINNLISPQILWQQFSVSSQTIEILPLHFVQGQNDNWGLS